MNSIKDHVLTDGVKFIMYPAVRKDNYLGCHIKIGRTSRDGIIVA